MNTLSVKRVTEISSGFVYLNQLYHYSCSMLSLVKAYVESSVSVKESSQKKGD